MASIVTFTRTPRGRSTQMNQDGTWNVTEIWQAVFDDELTDPLDFLGDVALPAIGDEHPENAILRLANVPNAVPPIDGSLKALDFTLTWTTARSPGTRFEKNRYVDSTTADKSWSHRIIAEPVEKAYVSDDDGSTYSASKVPVANTLGDLFIPGLTRQRYLSTCRYVRNELVVPTGILNLPGTINNDSFTLDGKSVTAGQALIVSAPVSTVKRFETYSFRTVDYEIMLKEEGWDDALLNKGFYYLQPIGLGATKRARVTVPNGIDEAGNERPWKFAEEPVVLNVNGRHLAEWLFTGNAEVDFVPHYRKFRYLNRTSFTALGFS